MRSRLASVSARSIPCTLPARRAVAARRWHAPRSGPLTMHSDPSGPTYWSSSAPSVTERCAPCSRPRPWSRPAASSRPAADALSRRRRPAGADSNPHIQRLPAARSHEAWALRVTRPDGRISGEQGPGKCQPAICQGHRVGQDRGVEYVRECDACPARSRRDGRLRATGQHLAAPQWRKRNQWPEDGRRGAARR